MRWYTIEDLPFDKMIYTLYLLYQTIGGSESFKYSAVKCQNIGNFQERERQEQTSQFSSHHQVPGEDRSKCKP